MATTKYYTGVAPLVAQIATGAIASVDATPANNTFTVTIGGIAVSVAGVTSAAATATALVAALNASTEPYFAAITWTVASSTNVVGTADVAGCPFTAVISVSGGGTGTVTAFAATRANSGPNDMSVAANYSDGALPATAVKQVVTITIDGTYSTSTTYGVTIGGVLVSVPGSGGSNSTVATALQVALAASTDPGFAAVLWTVGSTTVTGTARTAGVPFTATSSATGGTGTISGGVVTSAANVVGDTLILQGFTINLAYGLDMSSIVLAELVVDSSFGGLVGLDYSKFAITADGATTSTTVRPEYRTCHWKISATLANLAIKAGRFNVNFGTNVSTINVLSSPSNAPTAESARGAQPVKILCNHASTIINVRSGIVGVCNEKPAETSTLDTIDVADQSGSSKVYTGAGITLRQFVAQSGTHSITSDQTIAVIKNSGATITHEGIGVATEIDQNSGTFNSNNSGGFTTAHVYGGTFNTLASSTPRTGGTLNWNGGILMIDAAILTLTHFYVRPGLSDKSAKLSMAALT